MLNKPLIKVLTEAGIGSRRWVASAIRNGQVAVNGTVVNGFNHPVSIEDTRVAVSGKKVNLKPKPTFCLMLNKPKGILSTTRDERGCPTVIDLLPSKYRELRLHPVGRLDKESTGLILLSNDGALTYQLTHPRFEHEKEYLVHVTGDLAPGEQQKLEQGIMLEDGMTHPARVRKTTSPQPFDYSLALHEGRKRQVRRMFERLGHRVLALKRVRIGGLQLGNLGEGDIRKLSDREIQLLLQQDSRHST
jgi:23S rRNA pseudouridine2605 synthase